VDLYRQAEGLHFGDHSLEQRSVEVRRAL
jgi:hypothetical protein